MAAIADWRTHPTMRQLLDAAQRWRNAGADTTAADAARHDYLRAAACLIGWEVTRYHLDPMDCLPGDLMPLVWQDQYAEDFAAAVAQREAVPAAD